MTRLKYILHNFMFRFSHHDDFYNELYYEFVDEKAKGSAKSIACSIIKHFNPSSVIDVGCGTGVLIEILRSKNIKAVGLEYSESALKICHKRDLPVQKFDIENDKLTDPESFDLVVSTEVAEHLPEYCADRYVNILCELSNIVVFTAATPGQGGLDHVNEQPHEYWIAKFTDRGFQFEESVSLEWRDEWLRAASAPWYYNNLMIFTRCKH